MKYIYSSIVIASLLIAVLTIGVVMTGQEAQARGEPVNPFYGLGYCAYKLPGHFDECWHIFWQRLTDEEYEKCMEDTDYPGACLDDPDVIQS